MQQKYLTNIYNNLKLKNVFPVIFNYTTSISFSLSLSFFLLSNKSILSMFQNSTKIGHEMSDRILEKFKGSRRHFERSHTLYANVGEYLKYRMYRYSISSLSCQFHFARIRRILRTNKSATE